MTVRRFYRVFCDLCEAVHIHTRSDVGTANAARTAAKQDGWRHLMKNGVELNLCPVCREERILNG